MKKRTEPVPLFAYGTLRPGCALHHLIADDVVSSRRATLAGEFLLVGVDGWGYPWLVRHRAPQSTPVVGDLLMVRPGDALARTTAMEVQSGYRYEQVPVVRSSDGLKVQARTFVWSRPHWPMGATPVPWQDWKAFDGRLKVSAETSANGLDT